MKRKLIFSILMLFITIVLNAQSLSEKEIYIDYGTLIIHQSGNNQLMIRSYVTRQIILRTDNYEQKLKTVSTIPKYRYELNLMSKSKFNGKPIKNWIYNTRIYIDGIEITKEQFPEGFTALIELEPTVIYWYETSDTKINFKISWESSNYFQE